MTKDKMLRFVVELEFAEAVDVRSDSEDVQQVRERITEALWSWAKGSEKGLAPDPTFTEKINVLYDIRENDDDVCENCGHERGDHGESYGWQGCLYELGHDESCDCDCFEDARLAPILKGILSTG